jgi:hypothetical protein
MISGRRDRLSWLRPIMDVEDEAEEEEEMVTFNNPKTTLTGYLMLAASLLMVVAHGLSGSLGGADLTALLGAAGGVGLISAKDGGH